MKKLFLVIAFFLTASCTHQDQKVEIKLFFGEQDSEIGNDSGIEVLVFDDRADKEILGQKEFGDEKINIKFDQDLTQLLQQKISDNLAARGFKIGKEKEFEFHIKTLRYKASRGFPLGKSHAEIAMQIIVKNNKNGEKLTRNFSMALNNKHFIVPLESTDSATINSLLQEAVFDVLNDEMIIKNLKK